jgi:CRISPR-associated endoribonuclease Cas6
VKYKQFTFSWLDIPERRIVREGIQALGEQASFQISSPHEQILKGFVDGLLSEPEIRLGRAVFDVERVELRETTSMGGNATFRCLSPILVRTIREVGGKRIVWDLGPDDEKFFINLRTNLIKKYVDFGRTSAAQFTISGFYDVKRTRIRIKDTYNRAYFMKLRTQGDPELLTFAYDAGLGERNSMGFGMLEKV